MLKMFKKKKLEVVPPAAKAETTSPLPGQLGQGRGEATLTPNIDEGGSVKAGQTVRIRIKFGQGTPQLALSHFTADVGTITGDPDSPTMAIKHANRSYSIDWTAPDSGAGQANITLLAAGLSNLNADVTLSIAYAGIDPNKFEVDVSILTGLNAAYPFLIQSEFSRRARNGNEYHNYNLLGSGSANFRIKYPEVVDDALAGQVLTTNVVSVGDAMGDFFFDTARAVARAVVPSLQAALGADTPPIVGMQTANIIIQIAHTNGNATGLTINGDGETQGVFARIGWPNGEYRYTGTQSSYDILLSDVLNPTNWSTSS